MTHIPVYYLNFWNKINKCLLTKLNYSLCINCTLCYEEKKVKNLKPPLKWYTVTVYTYLGVSTQQYSSRIYRHTYVAVDARSCLGSLAIMAAEWSRMTRRVRVGERIYRERAHPRKRIGRRLSTVSRFDFHRDAFAHNYCKVKV